MNAKGTHCVLLILVKKVKLVSKGKSFFPHLNTSALKGSLPFKKINFHEKFNIAQTTFLSTVTIVLLN